jgi:glycosyltransferase involved in cell wall biosynthesis
VKTVAIIGSRGYPSHYGGFETAIRNLIPHLVNENFKVQVYCRAGETSEEGYSPNPNVERIFTRGLNTTSLNTLSHGLHACLHAFIHKPDVALVMNVANGYWIPLLRLRRIPVVVNVDGMEWQRNKWNKLGKFVFYLGALITSKTSTILIADSICIQKTWFELFGVDSTFIPYGGVVGNSRFNVRKDFVLYVARLVPENSVNNFLESIPMINPEAHVVIVGSKSTFDDIHSKLLNVITSHSRVSWLGRINDDEELFALWKECAVYFHGHTVGGTNPALVQAMASGAPVVAVDTIYNQEVLGTSGVLTCNIPDAIADTINSLLSDRDKREKLSRLASKRAQDHYSWDMVNSRYVETLELAMRDKTKTIS